MKSLAVFLFLCISCALPQYVFSQNNVLKKGQFEKSLAKFQECYAQETGVVNLETDVGKVLVFFREDEIKAIWRESTSDSTAVSHIRSLYADRYESKEFRHYLYQDDSLIGYTSTRECLNKKNKYDRNFVGILKLRKCIPDLGLQFEVWSYRI